MDIYLILVVVLFALALSDLVVGVSNDAVNFLNSAIGSNAAPLRTILIMASIGILVGVTFSGGLMEVARKGIFHPGEFYFSEIMIIFLAVMIADVILLDLFNTFGLPTSTTVSIVFELLGAAVAIALIKIYNGSGASINDYINTSTALGIISGILLSIVVAFTVGTIIQFIIRLVFSFNYEKTLRYFGALWGATGITSITYFILIKGAKGSTIISPEMLDLIKTNTIQIIIVSFLFWTIMLQLILWFTKVNILKLIVLVGTFALAMAFAGNDLVNFIGVPLAGFSSYSIFSESRGIAADGFLMTALVGKVSTETYLLILAGVVMIVTLWWSKKARTVTETEINLSRQGDGYERFGSSVLSRNVVRGSYSAGVLLQKYTPSVILRLINDRFQEVSNNKEKKSQKSSFDLLRASVNLTVASVLISFATSLKLPLSTTYVTFMVAMGTSFADGAWGRESAVYRVAGVTSVIGGWFMTAFGAFSGAFVIGSVIYFGGPLAVFMMIGIAVLFIFKTHNIHRRRQVAKKDDLQPIPDSLQQSDILLKSSKNIHETLTSVSAIYGNILQAFMLEKLKKVGKAVKVVDKLNETAKQQKDNVYLTINSLREDLIESGHFYVQVLDHLREMTRCLIFIVNPIYDHLRNTHKGLNGDQIGEFEQLSSKVLSLLESMTVMTRDQKFDEADKVFKFQQEILNDIKDLNKKQLKRIKKGEIGTRNGMLCLTVLTETKSLLQHSVNVVKAERDFMVNNEIL